MEALGQYVISVVTASIICGILLTLSPKGMLQQGMKLLCGLFLTFSVLHPVMNLDLEYWLSQLTGAYDLEGKSVAALGTEYAVASISERIKEETEAYILDKAASLGVTLRVDVEVSSEEPFLPVSVTLWGAVSSYVREQLQEIITNDLGISKENQRWTG